jgi:hypothetical protein
MFFHTQKNNDTGSGHETQQIKGSQRSEFLNKPAKIPMPCSNKFEITIKDEHINYYCSWLNYKNRKNKSIIKIGRKKKRIEELAYCFNEVKEMHE